MKQIGKLGGYGEEGSVYTLRCPVNIQDVLVKGKRDWVCSSELIFGQVDQQVTSEHGLGNVTEAVSCVV